MLTPLSLLSLSHLISFFLSLRLCTVSKSTNVCAPHRRLVSLFFHNIFLSFEDPLPAGTHSTSRVGAPDNSLSLSFSLTFLLSLRL